MFSTLPISKLLVALPFVLQTAPPPNTAQIAPPIRMGLWEATITSGMGTSMKTRSCMTQQTYQQQMSHLPANCTLSNFSRTSENMSGDVSCKSPNGMTSTGHFDAEFPNATTVTSTISITMNMQGRSMPMTIKTESHFISADCGGIAPGQSQIVH